MPSWSGRCRRMYEHNRDSSEERGVGQERAEEIEGRSRMNRDERVRAVRKNR